MTKNNAICEKFWTSCKSQDRENITILMSHAIETFPINFSMTLKFFSLMSKTSPDLCKQSVEYLTQMYQFCEYFEDIESDEFVLNGESIKLVKNRVLFGINKLTYTRFWLVEFIFINIFLKRGI